MITALMVMMQLSMQTVAPTQPTPAATTLSSFFPTSTRVTFVRVAAGRPTAAGAPAPLAVYIAVSVVDGVERVDGYAVLDNELGQHEQIGFAVRVSADGAVDRLEVTAYREAYGYEINSLRYRDQWRGKRLADLSGVGGDVDAISGATISSRSTARFIRRALLAVSLAQPQPLPPARR
jgi:Na+-translocating ferredoxin:NAD+ oxidoreductase subunit G